VAPSSIPVAFVVPFALDTTLRFARAAAALEGVELGIVSQEPLERLPEDLRRRVSAYARVADALDADGLERGVRSLGEQWGRKPERLIGVLEQLQQPLARVRERLRIRGMDETEATNFRDKSVMKDRLRAAGLPCARHALASDRASALAFGESSGYPLVVKPPAGAGSRNTFRVNSRAELEACLRTLPATTQQPLLLEEFIVGREHSFDSVSLGGKHVFHSISSYSPTPLEVMHTPWIQWCVLLPRVIDTPEYADILAAGRKALEVLGMVTGLTHMEWFRRADGSIAISEVAARPPGAQFTTLLSWAHDVDFYSAWARLMVHETFDPPQRRYSAGAAFLRGQGSGGVVTAVRGIDELRAELGALVVEARLPRIGQSASGTYDGEGYVILRDPDTAVVERGLQRAVELVRVELG